MSIKVIVTAVGQHVIADIKQIENKENEEVVGYWLWPNDPATKPLLLAV